MKAFLGTILGKVLIGVLAAAVVAGGGFAVYKAVQSEPTSTPEVTADEETTIEEMITTEAETAAEEDAAETPMTIKMTGVNVNPNPIERYTANPEAIFEWNEDGYWEFESGTCNDPEWIGGVGASRWTVPAGCKFGFSENWDNPTVEPFFRTGSFGPWNVGPGDRIYKIG